MNDHISLSEMYSLFVTNKFCQETRFICSKYSVYLSSIQLNFLFEGSKWTFPAHIIFLRVDGLAVPEKKKQKIKQKFTV